MNGIEMIIAERKRQIEEEGWTIEHDDKHTDGSINAAANAYELLGYARRQHSDVVDDLAIERAKSLWMWDLKWLKPAPDAVRNYVRAGALYRAEYERIERVHGAIGLGTIIVESEIAVKCQLGWIRCARTIDRIIEESSK